MNCNGVTLSGVSHSPSRDSGLATRLRNVCGIGLSVLLSAYGEVAAALRTEAGYDVQGPEQIRGIAVRAEVSRADARSLSALGGLRRRSASSFFAASVCATGIDLGVFSQGAPQYCPESAERQRGQRRSKY
jgi:hypothetical protein